MRAGLTAQQQAALDALVELTVKNVPPSYGQLATRLGLVSKGTVHHLLANLRDRGFVTFDRRGRSLRVLPDLDAYTPAALNRLEPDQLKELVANATNVLARKTSGLAVDA